MFNIPLIALCATLAPALQSPQADTTTEAEVKEVVNWAKKTAIPIETLKAESGLEDLQKAKNIVGDARIVGMGEATHGTHESSVMKHRMFEFLVKEKGFNIFGLESTYTDCLPINEYVLTGQGDPQVLLHKQGYFPWDTDEMLDLIRWMRTYNENPKNKRKLKFYGFDMQFPDIQAKAALDWLHEAKPELADVLSAKLQILTSDAGTYRNENYLKASPDERAATRESLKVLLQAYKENNKELTAKLGRRRYQEGLHAAEVAIQGEGLLTLHLLPRPITKEEIDTGDRFYKSSIAEVMGLRQKMSADLGKRVDRLIEKMKDANYFTYTYYTQFSERDRMEWRHTAEMLSAAKDVLTQGLSPEEAAKASQAIDDVGGVLRYQDVFAFRHPEDWREICMAKNIDWILKTEGRDSKMMTWSHNMHACKSIEPYKPVPYTWMGKYIANQWGDKYVAIGFSIFSGSVLAYYSPAKDSKIKAGYKVVRFKNSPVGSIDYTFSLVGYPTFLLDTQHSNDAEAQKWLDTPLQTRNIGAAYDPRYGDGYFSKLALAKVYNAVIFIRDTTGTSPTALSRKAWKITDLTPIDPN